MNAGRACSVCDLHSVLTVSTSMYNVIGFGMKRRDAQRLANLMLRRSGSGGQQARWRGYPVIGLCAYLTLSIVERRHPGQE